MIVNFLINILDTMNFLYIWLILIRKEKNLHKYSISLFICSILVLTFDYLGVNFIFSYIFVIIIIAIIYIIDFKHIILEFSVSLLIELSLQMIITYIANMFIKNENIRIIIIELINLSVLIIIYQIISYKSISFELAGNEVIVYFLLIFGINALVFKILLVYYKELIFNNLLAIATISFIALISELCIFFLVIRVIKENQELKISNEYNAVIDEIVEEIKQRQHDFTNYKNTITGILEVVDEDKIGVTIKNYIKSENSYDTKINELVYIDNVIIRSIIYMSICKAKKYDINFQYRIHNNVLDSNLSYIELSNVLNNLLNNAFDEVIRNTSVNKNIEVEVFKEYETSHLIVKNNILNINNTNINKMFTRGYTTKSPESRGYGLYNVEQIITSHRGCIEVNVETTEIVIDIYFNNSSG